MRFVSEEQEEGSYEENILKEASKMSDFATGHGFLLLM